MWTVICLAMLWIVIALTDTAPIPVRLGMVSLGLGYVVAWYVPVWLKNRHVKSQNSLLDRCRALLILGSQEREAGNKTSAEAALHRIRRLESRWALGNCIPFRISLALWAVAWG